MASNNDKPSIPQNLIKGFDKSRLKQTETRVRTRDGREFIEKIDEHGRTVQTQIDKHEDGLIMETEMAEQEVQTNLHPETNSSGEITIHPETNSPTKLWHKLRVKQNHAKVSPQDPNMPITEDKVRFVCISDTHSKIEKLRDFVPDGDVLLHGGDFTNVGGPNEVVRFNEFLGSLPHKYKIVIAGNHDLTFDDDLVKNNRDYLRNQFRLSDKVFEQYLQTLGVTSAKELLTNCIYLEDASVDIYGIQIYGSPWQPEFCGWGFNLFRGQELLDKWNKIPNKTDILITHGPPLGYGDHCFDGQHVGCVELLSTIQKRVKPLYHVAGHIHENYGITTDGHTTYINASTCTLRYKPINTPIVFDFPLPPGRTKQEVLDIKVQRS